MMSQSLPVRFLEAFRSLSLPFVTTTSLEQRLNEGTDSVMTAIGALQQNGLMIERGTVTEIGKRQVIVSMTNDGTFSYDDFPRKDFSIHLRNARHEKIIIAGYVYELDGALQLHIARSSVNTVEQAYCNRLRLTDSNLPELAAMRAPIVLKRDFWQILESGGTKDDFNACFLRFLDIIAEAYSDPGASENKLRILFNPESKPA